MRILVTGGLGFLGINMLQLLKENGDDVICIDHLGSCDKRHLKIAKDLGVNVIERDINEPIKIDGNIDQIYHMASRASPVDYQLYPVETALTGSIGILNMIKLSIEKNARLLFTSTSEVYGDPKKVPQREDYWGNVNPIGVRSCYDESKRFSEALLMAYHRQFGVDIKIVRIFNSFGPGLRIDDGRVISNFINQALKNKNLTLYGDGTQTRSFCFVRDTVEGLHKMMNSESFIGPVNIGNPGEITMNKLAKIIIKLVKSKSKLVYKPLPNDDPKRRVPDIELAMERLYWKPRIKFEDGINKTIEHYKMLRKL